MRTKTDIENGNKKNIPFRFWDIPDLILDGLIAGILIRNIVNFEMDWMGIILLISSSILLPAHIARFTWHYHNVFKERIREWKDN